MAIGDRRLKGFLDTPGGSLGPWYRKVNEAVAQAAACTEVAALVARLGEPDVVEEREGVKTPSDHMAALGSRFRFDDDGAERVLTWVDPYRPRRRYRFGVTGTRVTGHWLETVSD